MPNSNTEIWGMDERTFLILMHVSVLSGLVVPLVGLILPIVMWQDGKNKSILVDEHGKNVVNWLISLTIYSIVSLILCLVIIGCVLLGILILLMIIFAIIAAVKASNEIVWDYPLTIKFFK